MHRSLDLLVTSHVAVNKQLSKVTCSVDLSFILKLIKCFIEFSDCFGKVELILYSC